MVTFEKIPETKYHQNPHGNMMIWNLPEIKTVEIIEHDKRGRHGLGNMKIQINENTDTVVVKGRRNIIICLCKIVVVVWEISATMIRVYSLSNCWNVTEHFD